MHCLRSESTPPETKETSVYNYSRIDVFNEVVCELSQLSVYLLTLRCFVCILSNISDIKGQRVLEKYTNANLFALAVNLAISLKGSSSLSSNKPAKELKNNFIRPLKKLPLNCFNLKTFKHVRVVKICPHKVGETVWRSIVTDGSFHDEFNGFLPLHATTREALKRLAKYSFEFNVSVSLWNFYRIPIPLFF